MHEIRRNSGGAGLLLVILLAAALVATPAAALRDPAAVYCTAMHYTLTLTPAPGGGMADTCILPGGQRVDAWQFLQGQAAPEYGYCATQGYRQVIVNDPAACAVLMTPSCAACVLPDGSTTEVTTLMDLGLKERLCSGGTCCDPKAGAACSFAPFTVRPIWIAALALAAVTGIAAFLLLRRRRQKGAAP